MVLGLNDILAWCNWHIRFYRHCDGNNWISCKHRSCQYGSTGR